MASNITKPTLSFVGRPLRHKMSDTSDLAVNGAFAADTDWDKSDAALTIAAGVADWTGAQAGNADLSPTVPILTVGKTYFIKFTLTRTAGTLTTLCGSGTSGAALSASGNYVERLVCTGSTDLILRGDSSFIGTIDDVEVFLWVGSTDSGGGITYAGALAASTGGLFDPALIMHADGSPLYNNAGCTLSDSGGYVKITDAGNFGTDIPAGTLVNCDFSADFTDGVYEITASDADSITIDLVWGASVATAEVWVGGAFPNCQAAWDDDSTDVLDSAGNYHHRHIMTNVDEEFASSQTPAGGDRGSSMFEKTTGFHTQIHVASPHSGLFQIVSDMSVESYTGPFASNFTTSYYMGAIECIRDVEGATRKRPLGDQVSWDADDNPIAVMDIVLDNVQICNIDMHNTDRASGNGVITCSANSEGTWLKNCRLDDAYSLVSLASNMSECVFFDCYFGSNYAAGFASYTKCPTSLFLNSVFKGGNKTITVGQLEDSCVISCLVYGGIKGLYVESAANTSIINTVFFDCTETCISLASSTRTANVYNNVFSPAAAADYACFAGSSGTFIGSNNLAYSVTAGAALTTPFYNGAEAAAFWLDNTITENPQFEDAPNLDFRLKPSSPAWGSGIGGFDPDDSGSDIGLPASGTPTPGGGGILGQNWSF